MRGFHLSLAALLRHTYPLSSISHTKGMHSAWEAPHALSHTPLPSFQVIAWVEEKGIGSKRTNYKLRDWLFARQRYWGEPFPLVYPIGVRGGGGKEEGGGGRRG